MEKDKKELVEVTLSALERLLKMFQAERYIHLVLTGISFLLLLYGSYLVLTQKPANIEILVSIFGGGGLIAISSTHVSNFFNRAFTLVEDLIKDLSK